MPCGFTSKQMALSQEIEELIKEWEPEPLVPMELTEVQKMDLERVPILARYASQSCLDLRRFIVKYLTETLAFSFNSCESTFSVKQRAEYQGQSSWKQGRHDQPLVLQLPRSHEPRRDQTRRFGHPPQIWCRYLRSTRILRVFGRAHFSGEGLGHFYGNRGRDYLLARFCDD